MENTASVDGAVKIMHDALKAIGANPVQLDKRGIIPLQPQGEATLYLHMGDPEGTVKYTPFHDCNN